MTYNSSIWVLVNGRLVNGIGTMFKIAEHAFVPCKFGYWLLSLWGIGF